MYKCYECGKVFDEPKIVADTVPYGEGTVPRDLASCTHCNGGFDEAYYC